MVMPLRVNFWRSAVYFFLPLLVKNCSALRYAVLRRLTASLRSAEVLQFELALKRSGLTGNRVGKCNALGQ